MLLKRRIFSPNARFVILLALLMLPLDGCGSKQYVRSRVNERVTPLETRTGELEETNRRAMQELSRVHNDLEEARARLDRAQQQADRAASFAEKANDRVSGVERALETTISQLQAFKFQPDRFPLDGGPKTGSKPPKGASTPPLKQRITTDRPLTGSSPDPDYDEVKIKAALNKLLPGTIQFKTPTDMVVGRVETIEALITSLKEDLTRELRGEGAPQIEGIRIAPFMKAVLSAKDGDTFQITPVGGPDALRVVDTEGGIPTKWDWDVKPLKSGTNTLHLTVEAFVLTENKAPSFITTFDRDIKIEANYAYSAKEIIKSAWQFLASAIVIPLVILGWNTYSKRKKRPTRPSAPFE